MPLSKGGSNHHVLVGDDSYMTEPDNMQKGDISYCNLPGYPTGYTMVSVYAEWIDSSARECSEVNQSKKSHKDSTKGRARNSDLKPYCILCVMLRSATIFGFHQTPV